MPEFTVNSDNINTRTCQFITPFNNENFIIAGLSTFDHSPCLFYSNVFSLFNWNTGWYETKYVGMFDARSQQIAARGADIALPGQVCVPPNYIFDPYSQSVYNASAYKLTAIDATVCNNSEICSLPISAQNSMYNAFTHKVVAIDTTICNSSEVCYLPEEDQNASFPGENKYTHYDDSFYIGMASGVAGTLFLLAIGVCGYYVKNSLKKSHHVIPTSEHDGTELTSSTTPHDTIET